MLQAWLGLSYVDAAALWSLFVAFGASIIQVYDTTLYNLVFIDMDICSQGWVQVVQACPKQTSLETADCHCTHLART